MSKVNKKKGESYVGIHLCCGIPYRFSRLGGNEMTADPFHGKYTVNGMKA